MHLSPKIILLIVLVEQLCPLPPLRSELKYGFLEPQTKIF